ncbi:MAG: hypothetical protein IPH75_02485 [bacterium]|nr:hypothetical protein [bacterium]
MTQAFGDCDLAAFQSEGILPEAMFDYLCSLGGAHANDQEPFTRQGLIDKFDEARHDPAFAVMDEEKLLSLNRAHILQKSDHDLAVLVAPLLVDSGLTSKYWLETRWEYLRAVMRLLRGEVSRLTDFVEMGGYFFFFACKYDQKAEAELFTPEAAGLLAAVAERLAVLPQFTDESVEQTVVVLAGERGVQMAEMAELTRLAVSGSLKGPGFSSLLVTLSQPIVVERVKKAVDYIRTKHKL